MKKSIILLIGFILFVVFAFPAYSQNIGCCYSDYECRQNFPESQCPTGFIFVEDDPYCVSPPNCIRGCCCAELLNTPTTQAFCDSEGGLFYPHEEWTTQEYLELYGIEGPGSENIEICRAECMEGFPRCEYISCERNELSTGEKCYCGDGVFADQSNPYCCYNMGKVYSLKSACDAECQATDSIFGTVYGRQDTESDLTNVLPGASLSTSGKTTTSDSQGYYIFENIPSTGTILATMPGYISKTVPYNTIQDDRKDIILAASTLSCSPGQTRPCNVQRQGCDTQRICEDGVFSECRIIESTCPEEAVCGNNIWEPGELCEIINGVTYGCDPGEVCVDCSSCVPQAVCGNQILDPGEECDPDRSNPVTFLASVREQCGSIYAIDCTDDCKCVYEEGVCGDGKVTYGEQCDWKEGWEEGYFQVSEGSLCSVENCGRPGELMECKCSFINFNSCGDGIISGSETCEQDSDCPNNERCIDCNCESVCSEPPILSLDSYSNGLVSLSWILPRQDCEENIEQFYIYRCSATDNNACLDEGFVVDTTTSFYSLDSITPENNNYCYWVRANYHLEQGIVSADSNIVCINSGFEFCKDDTTTEFCQDNKRMRGDNTQILEIQDCTELGNYVCVADSNRETSCVYRADCEACNGIFNMFYLDGYTLDENNEHVPCDDIGSCYVDSTPTTVDKYHSCYTVNSCYDYLSESACLEDKCGVRACEWEYSSEYGYLGFGVCRSKDVSLQKCSLCMDPENAVFGECTRDFCQLYGDCYFDEFSNPNNLYGMNFWCLPYSKMSCDYYDYREDCGEDAVVDVVWDDNYENKIGYELQRPNPTNEITSPSTDLLGLGTCRWIEYLPGEYACAKDADNNIVNNRRLDGGGEGNKFDCPFDDLVCQRDNTPPNTTLIYRPVVPRTLDIEYTVFDDTYTKKDINTYFCIVPKDALDCYPNIVTRDIGFTIKYDGIQESGMYELYYFSEDYAHNLEIVRKAEFYVDTTIPQVDFDYTLDSEEIDPINFPGEWRTNFSASFNVSKKATCTAYLENLEGNVNYDSGMYNVYGDSFKVRYNYLEDDIYNFILVCEDSIGNKNTPTYYTIIINAEKSIYEPKPDTTIPSGENLAISVRTNRTAVCKYSLTYENYNEMEYTFDSQDRLYHYSMIDVPGRGLKLINVKCKFDDTGKIYGNRASNIRFAIDDIPPETFIVDRFNSTKPDDYLSDWKTKAEFYLLCKDEPIYENNNIYSKNWAFGCGSIYYGIGTPLNRHVDRYLVNLTQPGIYNINYYSVDKGNNTEEMQTKTIKIDNLDYDFTINMIDYITGLPADKVTLNRRYKVIVSSTKPVEVTYDQDYKIFVSSLSFRVGTRIVNVEPESPQDYISMTRNWSGQFFLDPNDFRDIDNYDAKFNIYGIDSHNIESRTISHGGNFTVHTKRPTKPLFDPLLEDYPLFGYPLHYYNGVFYTNDILLFVSAYYPDQITNVTFYLKRETQTLPEYRYFTYDQSENGVPLYTKELYQNADEGSVEIFIEGDAGHQFKPGNYIEFSGYERVEYWHYKEFYEIIEVDEPSIIGGVAEKTRIVISQGLEQDIPIGTQVTVYDGSHPQGWAGTMLYINPEHQGQRMLFVEVGDEAGNLNHDYAYIYLDTNPPKILDFSLDPPYGHSTNNNRTNISAIVVERGSGLDIEAINFTIKGLIKTNSSYDDFDVNEYLCNHDATPNENGRNICYHIIFNPDGDLQNDLYWVTLEVRDLAHNYAWKLWYFYIEAGSPNKPDFRLKDAPEPNPDPYDIWYINRTPEFTLNFSDPEPVNINFIDLYNETEYRMDNVSIDCNKLNYNYFECSFDTELSEQEYSLIVNADKLLSDGNSSPAGIWTFEFTIDKTPPEFEVWFYPNPTRPGINIDFSIFVENEHGVYSGKPHNLLGYFNLNDRQETGTLIPSFGEDYFRTFTIPASYDWNLAEPVQDFNITITLRDYAGNSNQKTYPIRIDDEPPSIEVSEVKSAYMHLKIQDERFTLYQHTPEDIEIILGRGDVNITGTIQEGHKGYDLDSFRVVVYDRELGTNHTFMLEEASYPSLLHTIPRSMAVRNSQGRYLEGDFRSNLLIFHEMDEEILNNIRFVIEDQAGNVLDSYLGGLLKDLKAPDLPIITIS